MAQPPLRPLSIKSWSEDDRPREKLLTKGPDALSDAELMAILLRSGSVDETAVDLGRRILADWNSNLNELGRAKIDQLMAYKGMGEAKAITILAALELGRRRQASAPDDKPQIKSSTDAYRILGPLLADKDHEQFWILFLNRGNRVIGRDMVSIGGITGTLVDPKVIYRQALTAQATGIILAHNHPSGTLQPSEADIQITRKLVQAGLLLDIKVMDHLIISPQGFFSFCDQGMI